MPHVRRKEMKVRIQKNFDQWHSWEVLDFIKEVAKFGKKFYTVQYYYLTKENPMLQYHAVAVSRDMIYDMWWNITCHQQMEFNEIPDNEWYEPPRGLFPLDADIREVLYPYLETKNVDYKKNAYMNVFAYNNFHLVQEINFET